jgi:hypothetical protein
MVPAAHAALTIAAVLALAPAPAVAQAPDPVAVSQALVIRGTMEGHAERDRARLEGRAATPALSKKCAAAWKRRDQMNRAERRRLYELCPR